MPYRTSGRRRSPRSRARPPRRSAARGPPRAGDRTAPDAPANASGDLADVPAVYDYLVAQNGEWTQESNEFRTTWPSSPVWSVVNGPWRLRRFELDGTNKEVVDRFFEGSEEALSRFLRSQETGVRSQNSDMDASLL